MQAPMMAVGAVAPLLHHLSQVCLLLAVRMQAAWELVAGASKPDISTRMSEAHLPTNSSFSVPCRP